MTPEQLDKIRIAVAEKPGWRKCQFVRCGGWRHDSKRRELGEEAPNYPANPNAAHELIEALRKEGWVFHYGNEHGPHACFRQPNGERHEATAETFPLAVCLAALKVWRITI